MDSKFVEMGQAYAEARKRVYDLRVAEARAAKDGQQHPGGRFDAEREVDRAVWRLADAAWDEYGAAATGRRIRWWWWQKPTLAERGQTYAEARKRLYDARVADVLCEAAGTNRSLAGDSTDEAEYQHRRAFRRLADAAWDEYGC